MSSFTPEAAAAFDAAVRAEFGIAPKAQPQPVDQEAAAELLARHHKAYKARKSMEARVNRELAPFRGELSEQMLLELSDGLISGGALHGENTGQRVDLSALADPNRTAADAAREAGEIANRLDAERAHALAERIRQRVTYDADGNPVGLSQGIRVPDPR